MIACIVILVIGLIVAGLFTCEKVRKYSIKATIIKAAASILFIILALVANHVRGNTWFGTFAIGALALGMLGDIWLELKYVYPQDDKPLTYAGFVCFGLGHILYITGMIMTFYQKGHIANLIVPFAIGLLAALLILVLEKPLKLQIGDMKVICFLYSVLLFSMVSMAFSLLILHGFKMVTLILVSIGGALFAISDLVLSQTYFGQGHDKPFDLISNVAMYYIAQNLIAFSIYFIDTVL